MTVRVASFVFFFFFSSRRRHTRFDCDWSSDVCSSDLYDDPDATAIAVDRDGWLHTGDIGARDTDGALRISDRKKDIYISGGFNVSPEIGRASCRERV